jgi:hypothetical protein
MEFEPFYTRLVIENKLLPEAARDVWVTLQSAVSFHFSRVAEREIQSGRSVGIPPYMMFNMWVGLVHYYLSNGDLFAPEESVIGRYGELMAENFIKLIHKES